MGNTFKSGLFQYYTAAAEIVSSIGFLFFSILCFVSFLTGNISFLSIPEEMKIHPLEFWFVISFILGFLQLISSSLLIKALILKALMSWVNGSLWIWISLANDSLHFSISEIGAFSLGLANLYAFIVNTSRLKGIKWN